MQIVVNTRLLIKNRLDGMGWFSYQTLKRITQKNPDVHFVFLFDRPFDESFIFSDNITPLVIGPQARHPFLYLAWFQGSVKNLLGRMNPDLFLSPDGFLCLGASCKQLPVIHDINFLHHPQDSKWLTAKYYNYYFPRFAKAASRIATVSEFSKQEISSHYHINPNQIDVVYNGIHDFFHPLSEDEKMATRTRYTAGSPYFVNVGALHPRKNIPALIEAFALFKKQQSNPCKLVLAGPSYWGTQIISRTIEKFGLKNEVLLTGHLQDEELNKVLASAEALTFVPYYEGFGIPLVEAMQTETPIITSDVSSLPEVAGEAALLVNPHSPENISNAMHKVYTDKLLKQQLIEKGRTQKLLFSWDKSSDLLWKSIQTTIHQKG